MQFVIMIFAGIIVYCIILIFLWSLLIAAIKKTPKPWDDEYSNKE